MINTKQNKLNLDPEILRKNLPKEPGVYIFRDRVNTVVYVGKAKNIKSRVSSYLKPVSELTRKTAMMINRSKYLEYIITTTEKEALILESNLIKKHKPRYNIVLRDDKQYPYLRLGVNEKYSRLGLVRKIKKDGAIYFGPYSSSTSVRSTLRLINRIFRIRKCKSNPVTRRPRPCLNFQLGRCLGPCAHDVPVDDYKKIVDKVRLFLEGRNRELVKQLEKEMGQLAQEQKFEEAARVRDQVKAVERTVEKQSIISGGSEDQDVIGVAQKEGVSALVVLFVRKGAIMGSRDYRFENYDGPASSVTEAFLKQYYSKDRYIPKNILISESVDELRQITDWLSEIAGKKISIYHPIRGKKVGVVNIAVTNARDLLSRHKEMNREDLLELLKSVLKLKRLPRRIEGLDISTFQGSQSVGTIVSFLDGQPEKSGYRNYRIKNVDNIDDYGMMSEMASRRLASGNPPDLFLVDGGKGHLQAVERILHNFPGEDVPELAAIAKARGGDTDKADKIYIPGRKNPLTLRRDHPALLFFMRIRDETHRRAITYHRKLRNRNLKVSALDQIPGIGQKRKMLLLKKFGDINKIAKASLEELAAIPGISESLAEKLHNFLSN